MHKNKEEYHFFLRMSASIWAVIAAKNEEKDISSVIKETKKFVDEVIVVDDGSSDSTGAIAKKAGATLLTHVVNLGKGAATNTGCEYAISKNAKIIVLLDADGQHEPKDIPKFVQALRGNDIVFGIRTEKKSMPLILKFGNNAINRIAYVLFGIYIADTQCGFRAFRAATYKKIRWKSRNYSMESEMIAHVGKKRLKYAQIPISTIYADKYKGTTVIDGIKIVLNMVWWKISR